MNENPFSPIPPAKNPYESPQHAGSTPIQAAVARPAPKPRIWTVWVTLIAALCTVFVAQIVGVVAVVIYFFATGGNPQELQAELLDLVTQPGVFIFLGLLSQVAIGGTALAAAWLSPVPLTQRLGMVSSRLSAPQVMVLIAGALVPFAVGMAGAYALAEVIEPDPSVAAMYENLTLGWAIPFLLFIALAPGLCEELLFRGYMQRRLLERWYAWVAVLVTSLVFALFHIMPHAVVFAFPVGIWLGLMAVKSGSVWPGVVCHATINGLWNVWQLGVRFEFFPENPPLALLVLLGLVGVAAFGTSVWILFRPIRFEDLLPNAVPS